jgi:PAS domain S-box-containing protein
MDKANILLVDDQPGKLLTYQATLADLGDNLITATSGREALLQLLKHDFALILLDVVMPEMDGFETAALIRQRPRLEHTPIIFVTAYSSGELDPLKGYELGAVDYVFAPIVPEVLRAKVSVFVDLYRKRQELTQINDQLRAEIVERRLVEYRLQKSEERFRLLVENVKDYDIIMLDPQGRIITWNAGAERLKGYRSDEIIGQHFSLFYRRDDVENGKPEIEIRSASAEGRFEDEGWRVRKDGTQFWANVIVTPLRDQTGLLLGFAKITRDLTEWKRAQERAMQSERLAAIGQMVAGLAHESRNSLQHIQASTEMLVRRIKSEPELGLVRGIQKAHDRMHRLLEDVRGYSAPIKLDCQFHDLAHLWREAWNQLAPQRSGRDVILDEHLEGVDVNCLVDPYPIERLFRNIFENSLAACPDPLRIDVICASSYIDDKPAIRIRVADNGPGLTTEGRDRIFEPFFTTKTKGTGLGMAIVKRIVEVHGGRIAVCDDQVPGTALEVLLPKG